MNRAAPSGVVLDEDDAAIVKGMLARGDRQHDIAAWFGVQPRSKTSDHKKCYAVGDAG